MSHDDKYKQSFKSYRDAAKACKPGQKPYRRASDGRWCLTHIERRRLRYNRAEQQRSASKHIARYI